MERQDFFIDSWELIQEQGPWKNVLFFCFFFCSPFSSFGTSSNRVHEANQYQIILKVKDSSINTYKHFTRQLWEEIGAENLRDYKNQGRQKKLVQHNRIDFLKTAYLLTRETSIGLPDKKPADKNLPVFHCFAAVNFSFCSPDTEHTSNQHDSPLKRPPKAPPHCQGSIPFYGYDITRGVAVFWGKQITSYQDHLKKNSAGYVINGWISTETARSALCSIRQCLCLNPIV